MALVLTAVNIPGKRPPTAATVIVPKLLKNSGMPTLPITKESKTLTAIPINASTILMLAPPSVGPGYLYSAMIHHPRGIEYDKAHVYYHFTTTIASIFPQSKFLNSFSKFLTFFSSSGGSLYSFSSDKTISTAS